MGINGVSSTTLSRRQEVTFSGGETVVAGQPNGGATAAEQSRRLSSAQVCLQDGDTTHCEIVETRDALAEATARRDAAVQRMNDQRAVRASLTAALEIPRPARSAPNGVSSERDAQAFRECGDRTRTRANGAMVMAQVTSAAVGAVSYAMLPASIERGTEAAEIIPFHAPTLGHAAAHWGAEAAIDFGLTEAIGHGLHSSDPRSMGEHAIVAGADAALPGVGTLVSSVMHEVMEQDARLQCMANAAQQARRNRLEGARAADGVHNPEQPLEGVDVQRMRTDRDYYDGVVQRLRERMQGQRGVRG